MATQEGTWSLGAPHQGWPPAAATGPLEEQRAAREALRITGQRRTVEIRVQLPRPGQGKREQRHQRRYDEQQRRREHQDRLLRGEDIGTVSAIDQSPT